MCGIAGVLDLGGQRAVEATMVERMGRALHARGPDESGVYVEPGLGLTSQRLAIIGLENGRQPIWNEERTVVVVCNGEFFDFPERRARLEARGHRFRTNSDCEILVHLWEEYGEDFFPHLKGQFAFALFDTRHRQLILARDRLGICPLYYCRQEDWLYFGSEIKALLASGQVKARVDRRALDHVFSFFAMASRRTMFAGVQCVLPGTYLRIGPEGIEERTYWDLNFPDQGQERRGPELLQELGQHLVRAVQLRLRAEVPVVSYLSGGVDSSLVATLASRELGRPVPTFSIRIPDPRLDEISRALEAAHRVGSTPTIVECGDSQIAATYPDLVVASECPVIDTSSAAIYRLAARVHQEGFKVALTGEGADEALAGYPWFKVHQAVAMVDQMGWGQRVRQRFFGRANRRGISAAHFFRRYEQMGGVHATSDLYAACSLSGFRVYSDSQLEALRGVSACDDLQLNLPGMARWHPLHRSLYLGYKVMLCGLLMTHKGDRPAMANSVETRFPFLDEDFVEFAAGLAPELKLKGWFRDKFLLREYAAQFLPASVARRPKHIFRAHYSGSFLHSSSRYVEELLSPESLARTDYFDPARVAAVRRFLQRSWLPQALKMREEVALVGVVSTQLWHHLFLGGGLCHLPTASFGSGPESQA